MAESDFALLIERLDGERLVLDGLALARAFFTGDASSTGVDSFDSLAGTGNADRIELGDVVAMNRTMRARSPHKAWTAIIETEAPWLTRVTDDLDLLELDEDRWEAAAGDELVTSALAAIIGPGRGMAVATKVLHLKRPRLFPVLDRFVAEMLGMNMPDAGTAHERVEIAVRLTRAIRSEGRRNLATLCAIRDVLAGEGIRRSLVRVFDGIVWFSHPAAGIKGSSRVIDVRMGTTRTPAGLQ